MGGLLCCDNQQNNEKNLSDLHNHNKSKREKVMSPSTTATSNQTNLSTTSNMNEMQRPLTPPEPKDTELANQFGVQLPTSVYNPVSASKNANVNNHGQVYDQHKSKKVTNVHNSAPVNANNQYGPNQINRKRKKRKKRDANGNFIFDNNGNHVYEYKYFDFSPQSQPPTYPMQNTGCYPNRYRNNQNQFANTSNQNHYNNRYNNHQNQYVNDRNNQSHYSNNANRSSNTNQTNKPSNQFSVPLPKQSHKNVFVADKNANADSHGLMYDQHNNNKTYINQNYPNQSPNTNQANFDRSKSPQPQPSNNNNPKSNNLIYFEPSTSAPPPGTNQMQQTQQHFPAIIVTNSGNNVQVNKQNTKMMARPKRQPNISHLGSPIHASKGDSFGGLSEKISAPKFRRKKQIQNDVNPNDYSDSDEAAKISHWEARRSSVNVESPEENTDPLAFKFEGRRKSVFDESSSDEEEENNGRRLTVDLHNAKHNNVNAHMNLNQFQ